MNSKKKSILLIAALLAAFGAITLLFGEPLVRFAANPRQLRDLVDTLGPAGPLAMIGMMFLQVVVAFIPGEVFEIGAGYAFGAWYGLALCLIGTMAGSALIFLFTKKLGIRMAGNFLTVERINSLSFIRDSKRRNLLVFLLFFLPGTPKDVFTYFIGLTPMKFHTFVLLTSVARIPSVLTSTLGGDALGLQSYGTALLVFAVTGILSLAGLLIYRRIEIRENEKKLEKQGEKKRLSAVANELGR